MRVNKEKAGSTGLFAICYSQHLICLEHFTIKLNQLDRYDNAKKLKSRASAAIQPARYPL
ncbi:hypothetical protein MP213Fo_22330 [Pseudochrobactrum sp. MP213Fo]